MRRLRDFQPVTLYVGDACVPARVVHVSGADAQLAVAGELPDDAGALPGRCQLAFDHEGRLVMLDGQLHRAGPHVLRFFVADGVGSADQRKHVRLAVRLDAVVGPADGSRPPLTTATRDVSAGGVLLANGTLGAPGDALRIALVLPRTAGTVHAVGRVVRCGHEQTAVAFTHLDAADQELLRRFVERVRERLAARFLAA